MCFDPATGATLQWSEYVQQGKLAWCGEYSALWSNSCSPCSWALWRERPAAIFLTVVITHVAESSEYDSNTKLTAPAGVGAFSMNIFCSFITSLWRLRILLVPNMTVQHDKLLLWKFWKIWKFENWNVPENTLLPVWYLLTGLAVRAHMLSEGAHRLVSPEGNRRKCVYVCRGLDDSVGSSQQQPVKRCWAYWKCPGVISPGKSTSVGGWAGRLDSPKHSHQAALCFGLNLNKPATPNFEREGKERKGRQAGAFASSWMLRQRE